MDKPLYLYDKLLWDLPDFINDNAETKKYIAGPYCPTCKHKLDHVEIQKFHCWACNKDFRLSDPYEITTESIVDEYFAKERMVRDVVSLDLPPTKVEAYQEDDKYFVSARLTQREGRRMLIVYIGEKKTKQDKTDYSQIFVDLDQKQIRYDTSNKILNELLATLVCEFKEVRHTSEFKKQSGSR